jgi:outer membrane receptor protein involved in Fe transport
VDRVFEASASPYVEDNVQWTQDLRTLIGLRAEGYRFNVASSYAPFSGVGNAGLVSPKVSIVMGPWGALDVYVNGGYGFHSTDVRGARFKASSPASFGGVSAAPEHFPVPGGPSIQFAPLLTRTRGAELGARLTGGSRASISAALWELEIASEHVFLGDAGFSSPSRPSRRTGIELSNEVRPVPGVHVDADLAYSRARFTDRDPAGDRIPGAVEGVASAGIEYEHPSGEFAGLRLRYFGPRPLIEDNSVRSHASTVLNADLGYTVRRTWAVTFQVFNVLDAKVSDVDYYYTSRLPGEPAQGIADIHFHPQEPRSIRFIVSEGAVR